MVPNPPTPIPTIYVHVAADGTTPWWWGYALAGIFVLLGAGVAWLSLRASDKRKLEREDRRQWDKDLRAVFVRVSSHISALTTVANELEYENPDPDLPSAVKARALLQNAADIAIQLGESTSEVQVFAGPEVQQTMRGVHTAAITLMVKLRPGTPSVAYEAEFATLRAARGRLLVAIQRSVRTPTA